MCMCFFGTISAAANRALKAEREKSFSAVQDRLMRSYGSSRLAQPLIDRAHRFLESSTKRNPHKRTFKNSSVADHFGDPSKESIKNMTIDYVN